MCTEIGSNSGDFDVSHFELDKPSSAFPKSNFHEHIFSQGNACKSFVQNVTLLRSLTASEKRVEKASFVVTPLGVSGEGGVTFTWGDDKGVQVSGHASASISDENGNSVEATIEVESDGSGKATISAKHEEE